MKTARRPVLPIGTPVLIEYPEGWKPGTVTGHTAGGPDEDFSRYVIAWGINREAHGAHPDCVRERQDRR